MSSFVKADDLPVTSANSDCTMHVEISLRNQQKLTYLVELLRSLDFVESVTIRPDAVKLDAATPELSLFDQFYGSTASGQTIEELDEQLNALRSEWNRDF